ncbi:hypothetical protein V6Z12_A08G162600 [Gossypium hirsutum]
MSCFLLPNSLCGEIENICARFWWQKGHGKRGIHWCQWKHLCRPKEECGMGFRSMTQFNIALLAKQGWRFINYPNSLVAQVFKAKYFPEDVFLNSRLGNNNSFVWRSIWATKGILEEGCCWKVGSSPSILVINDNWIPDSRNFRLSSSNFNLPDFKVAELIDSNKRKWKRELIVNTLTEVEAGKILSILLVKEPHADILTWSGEPSGEYSV